MFFCSDGLTFRKQRATITSVKRALKKVIAFGLVASFIYGAWCASMAAPGLSVASAAQRCPENSSALENCDPTHLCAFASSFNLLPEGTFVSARNQDFLKSTQSSNIEPVSTGSSYEISLAASGFSAASAVYPAQKEVIYLFNSVLTL